MKRVLAVVGLALALPLGGCGQGGGRPTGQAERFAVEAAAPVPPPALAMAPKIAADEAPAPAPGPTPTQPSAGVPTDSRLIAYTYQRTVAAPTARVEEVMNAHRAACEKAGPSQCYVVSSSISGLGTESVGAQLQIKAAPSWVKPFLGGLPGSLKAYDATVESTQENSEDLTTQIVDTSARLNAKKVLRDRLEKLLKDRPGQLKDLLAVERELADVQGEIDATESVLARMKLRVSMSDLTIAYQPRVSPASKSVWRPLSEAFGSFFSEFASALGDMVVFVARLLPWLPVIAGVGWFFVWLFRWFRRRPARAAKGAPPGPAPSAPPTP